MAASLRLEDYSDRELLAVVADHLDAEGWADSREFATSLVDRPKRIRNDKDFEHFARQCVGIRFGWMARPPHRYGPALMERDQRRAGYWRLTQAGRELLNGRLTTAQQRVLDGVKDEQMMHFFDGTAAKFQVVPAHVAQVMRRAWRHGTYGRRF